MDNLDIDWEEIDMMDRVLKFEYDNRAWGGIWDKMKMELGITRDEHQYYINLIVRFSKTEKQICSNIMTPYNDGSEVFREDNILTPKFIAKGGFRAYYENKLRNSGWIKSDIGWVTPLDKSISDNNKKANLQSNLNDSIVKTLLKPNKVDWPDVMLFLKNELQPQSIEEIMVGLCGESEMDNISLSKKINQIVEMLLRKNYIIPKERKERKIDGLPYIQAATTYYLSYDGTSYCEEHLAIFNITDEEIGLIYLENLKETAKKTIKKSSAFTWNIIKGIGIILGIVVAIIEISKYQKEQSSKNGTFQREYSPENH